MKRKLMKTNFNQKYLKKYSDSYIKFFSATGIDNESYDNFKRNESAIISNINKETLSGEYNFVRYKEKLILKDRNSIPRCISIPTLKDKLCLKACLETLKEYFPECKRPALPQECIKKIKNSIDNKKYDYFIKIDISNFYGEIKHYKLMNMLEARINDEKFLGLIDKAISNPTYPDKDRCIVGVPQGLSISNVLAQIYMLEFDRKFNEYPEIFCIRYVDDILVLCSSNNKYEVLESLNIELRRNHLLPLNEQKFMSGFLAENSFSFLGYKIQKKEGLKCLFTIKENNKYKIENRIIKLINQLKNGKIIPTAFIFELNLIITGSISSKVNGDLDVVRRYGWLFFYSQMTDESVFFKLDALIKKNLVGKSNLLLNEEDIKKVKKFSKAFFEIKHNLKYTNYVFKPDELSLEDQKNFLKETYDIDTEGFEDFEIEKEFRNKVYSKIKQNELDLFKGVS